MKVIREKRTAGDEGCFSFLRFDQRCKRLAVRSILAAFGMVFTLSGVSHGETPGTPLSGSIVGWGSYVVGGDMSRGFSAVAAGTSHSLGLKDDGSIVAWGYSNHGQCNVPEPNTGFKAVVAGDFHSLGLKDNGSIVAWGDNSYGQCNVPEPNSGFKAVAAGLSHSLGLREDGSVVMWGSDGFGQHKVPEPNSGFKAVAAGGAFSLGLKEDGSIVAWGDNSQGQINVPEPNSGFRAIAAGGFHGLGLKDDGSVVAWGDNREGQCVVPGPNTEFTAVAAGWEHSLGVKEDGTIVAWGNDRNGKVNVSEPNREFMDAAAGGFHSLGLKEDGSIVSWGGNNFGQRNVPEPNTGFVAVAAKLGNVLGLKAAGSIIYPWGLNTFGEGDVPEPNTEFMDAAAGGFHGLGLKEGGSIVAWGIYDEAPDPNTGFTAVAAGSLFSLGLKDDGSIVAWGDNSEGQCDVPEPNTGFAAVAAGESHGLGLKDDGSIVAWGNNSRGQCVVPPETNFTAVAAGGEHSLGLKDDGSIVAWGDNRRGQCDVPEPNTAFTAVAAGESHSLGLKEDGSIVAWGDNRGGQCDVPQPNRGFVAMAAGASFSVGVRVQDAARIMSPTRSGILVQGDTLRFSGSPSEVAAAAYLWDFGDGRNSVIRNPGLLGFPETGEFTVSYGSVTDGQAPFSPDTRTYTVVADTGDIPDLRVTHLAVPDSLAAGQTASISYTVKNTGLGVAEPAWNDAIYLSGDPFPDVGDRLLGSVHVDQPLDAGASYQETIDVTIPALDEGVYYLILVVNDGWQVLELQRLNNEQAFQVTALVPALVPGEAATVSYPAGRVEQFFQMTADESQSLLLDLTGLPAGMVVYVRFGTLPARASHDYRFPAGDRCVIPAAADGIWYVLVDGQMEEPGRYDILFERVGVALTAGSPALHDTETSLDLTLSGSGFIPPMVVELVSGQGRTYEADEVEVDSFTRATAAFAAGTVPEGIYAVRIMQGGQIAELPGALEIVAGGEPKLETSLILPANIGYNAPATIHVEYANTGDAAMPAPLLLLTATQGGRQGAVLTLEYHNLSRGIWAAGMGQGFSPSVQFLASGETPGTLRPGETGRVPVYYAGWMEPWDIGDDRSPIDWSLSVLTADNRVPAGWADRKEEMRPDYIREDAWDVIWDNFTALAGDTWGDYLAMLNRNALYLHRQGVEVENVESLLAFSMRLAEGLSPLSVLAGGTDAFVQAPGMPVVFERFFLQPISRRFEPGDLGRGWSHNWRQYLTVKEDGAVFIFDMTGTPRIFNPDSRYAGRFLAQPGDQGDLRAADGGYRLTEASGEVQFFRNGKLEHVEDTNGNRITCQYIGERLTRLSHSSGAYLDFTYDASGTIASVTDSHGRRTGYTYTGEHLTAVESHDGRAVTFAYNATGAGQHALTAIGMPDRTTRDFSYDERGRLTATWRDDQKEKVTFTLSNTGRIGATDALGNTGNLFFDHWARLVKTENSLGEAVHLRFDNRGNLISVTDPDGFSASLAYDNRGNITEITDRLRRITRFTRTQSFNRLASVTDALSNQTEYAYDEHGNLTTAIHPDGSSEGWAYDARGNPTVWTNRRGSAVVCEFDADGLLMGKTFGDGTRMTYLYDDRGNLLTAENEQGVTTFTYNEYDYLMRVDYPENRWLAFTYDAAGRRSTSENQLGHVVSYHYDDAGRLERLSDSAADIAIYEYDALGRLSRKTLGNGVYTTYAYDSAGRLSAMENHKPGGETLSRFAYTHDRRSRRVAMQTNYGTWTYEYDHIGQLVRAALDSADPDVVPHQELAFEYDALGNRVRTTVNGVEEAYDANKLNQYVSIGDRTYTYDPDGNLIQESGPDGTTIYTYNDENLLTGVTRGGDTWVYAHDALGNRVAVDENGAVTHFVYDPIGLGNLVGEYNATGDLIARYIHGGGLISRTPAGGGTDYYTFDPMANTSEVTGGTGAVRSAYAYRPFGDTILSGQTVPNPFTFMGKFGIETDAAGLHHVRARHYDAGTGRFTSPDPIGFAGGDINLYRYVKNSPIDYFDPTGLRRICGIVQGGLNIAGGFGKVFGGSALILAAPKTAGLSAYKGAAFMGWGYYDVFRGVAQASWHSAAGLTDLFFGMPDELKWVDNGLTDAFQKGLPSGFLDLVGVREGGFADKIADIASISGLGDLGLTLGQWWAPDFCAPNKNPVDNPEPPTEESNSGDTPVVVSRDPNEKTGVAGFGAMNFVKTGTPLSYRIDFENYASATAPAQIVTIRDPLSPDLDWSTFELGEIGFGDVRIQVPPGLQSFETLVDYEYKDDEYDFRIHVQVEANLENGTLHVNFFSIDPETGFPPPVNIGFLMPETEPATGRGLGYVTYLIRPKKKLESGVEIRNVATIQFDYSLEIDTNQVDPLDKSQGTDPDKEALVTFDAVAPASRMSGTPEELSVREFEVSWSGEDDEQGSGLLAYEIYLSVNGGPYTLWLTTTESSVVFTGECGSSYSFYSVAVDNVGNKQEAPAGPDITIEIPGLMGDVDRSGTVDLADLILVLQGLSRTGEVHLGANVCADVDGDGRIGMEEAIFILQELSEAR